MKNIPAIFAITLLVISGCTKDKMEPISFFSFRGDTITTLKMGTFDTCTLVNKSINADSVFWDLGDGRTSREHQLVLSYPKSGTYTIKLISKNSEGQNESSKRVVVLDRVLKKIVVDYVQWDTNNTEGWPTSSIADVYFQIQMFTDGTMNPMGIYPECPVLYTSSIVKNINNHYAPPIYKPIEIPVTEKIVINKNLTQWANAYDKINKAYLFSLMAIDSNGKIYCLENSSQFGGNSFQIIKDDIVLNIFKVQFSFYSSVSLVCEFE